MNCSKRTPISNKTRFTTDDDKALSAAVQMALNAGSSIANLDWIQISKVVSCKSPRQCRERWQNYLNPCLTDKEWTSDEDAKIMSLYQNYGQMWTKIARHLPGRTGNGVRNRYMKLFRRQSKIEQLQYRAQALKRSYPYLANNGWANMNKTIDKQKVASMMKLNTPHPIPQVTEHIENVCKESGGFPVEQNNLEDNTFYSDLFLNSIDSIMDSFYDMF